jgi:amidase
VKVDAYHALNKYFSELTNTTIKTIEDVVQYNIDNKGTEGAEKGDHPAFRSGQVS